MSTNKLATTAGALVLLIVAALALYRLLAGFPISIGGQEIGQTTSFFVFVICTALALMLFRGAGKVSN
jgi:hypothetical protein